MLRRADKGVSLPRRSSLLVCPPSDGIDLLLCLVILLLLPPLEKSREEEGDCSSSSLGLCTETAF